MIGETIDQLLFFLFQRDHFLRIETGNRCRNGEILHQCPVCIDLILVHKTALLTDIHGCKGTDRNTVVEYVESRGVQTRLLFAGNLIKHPCFDEMRAEGKGYRVVGDLTNTDRIMRDTFWVGVYPGMNDEMIDYMAKTIREALDEQ